MGFGNGHVVPAGPLRETIEDAVAKANLLLTIAPNSENHDRFLNNWDAVKELPHAAASIKPLKTGMDWDGMHALAFAGIGRPEKFYNTLKELGVVLKGTRSFDDHQTISTSLLLRLENEAMGDGCAIGNNRKGCGTTAQRMAAKGFDCSCAVGNP